MFSSIERKTHLATTLLSADAVAEDADGASVRLPDAPNGYALTLDVTADESTASDTLDVLVQTKLDGTNWTTAAAFTQHVGNAGAKRYIAKISGTEPESMFEVGSALSAGSVRHLIGDEWRVSYSITDDSGSAAFTFDVTAIPL